MIKENCIIFGRGTVRLHSDSFSNILSFQEIYPAAPIGKDIPQTCSAIGDEVKIHMSMSKYRDFIQKLSNVMYNPRFMFEGYVFDFTNYNKASVDVVKKHAGIAVSGLIMLIAC